MLQMAILTVRAPGRSKFERLRFDQVLGEDIEARAYFSVQDRSMMQLMDKLNAMAESQARAEEHFSALRQESKDTRRRMEMVEHVLKIKLPELTRNSEDARSSTVDMDAETSRNRSASQELPPATFHKTVPHVGTGNDTPSSFPAGPPLTATVSKGQAPITEAELFVPTKHTTGAHNMLKWPILEQLIDLDGIIPRDLYAKEQYPQHLEIRRGLLKLYGRGEGPKHGDRSSDTPGTPSMSGSMSELGDDAASISSASDSPWGTGFHSPPNTDTLLRPEPEVGGLNPDGTLKLDSATIKHLLWVFQNHVWLMHPCIPKDTMIRLIKVFIAHYSPDSGQSDRSPYSINHDPELPFRKRKRSQGGIYPIGGSSSPDNSSQRPKALPERSINNAIVLLILALGKICDVKTPIPPFPGEGRDRSSRSAPGESPSNISRPSPGSSSAFQSPNPETHQLTPGSRGVSTDGYVQNSLKDSGRKNSDVIPGLAYYAYATDILGNLQGGNDTSHAQAFILAALYSAQLVRVMDSFSWLTQATRACQILVQTDHVVDDKINDVPKSTNRDPRQENIRLLYWTCLQLESDILAELDALSASGLYYHEDVVAYPKGVFHDMPDPSEMPANIPDMMLHYSGQIQLRRFLNKVHKTNFYKQGEPRQRPPEGNGADHEVVQSEWEGVETPEETYQRLTSYLDDWKAILPPHMQWDEEDAPPPAEINQARLRAKYYGARYVLNRPFLLQAIEPFGVKERKSPVSEETIMHAAETCVAAAIRSTVAFDGLPGGLENRILVTSIFGTAHAQFGNCLVLAATHKSLRLKHLVDREKLDSLLDRTIKFLSNYELHSPTLKCDKLILMRLKHNLDKPVGQSSSMSLSSSFGSNK
ncbi:MAG: hypothetical protein Q9157_007964 [Trypethelium eluteriae]